MKQRRLRSFVMPTIYVLLLMLVFGTVSLVSSMLKDSNSYLYSVPVLKDEAKPVVETTNNTEVIIKPFTSEKVEIEKYFYDVNETTENQEKALIYFENTYMKNTGVLYKSAESFDVLSVLDGVVASVKDDEILGSVVEIEHSTSLRTIYYGLKDTNLKIGDSVMQGSLVGTSGTSMISEASNILLFEVYYNGTLINPEVFYTMSLDELE